MSVSVAYQDELVHHDDLDRALVEAGFRPNCKCHGKPMHHNGPGKWRCSVKNVQRVDAYRAASAYGRALKRVYDRRRRRQRATATEAIVIDQIRRELWRRLAS